ncbi:MAG TPA: protein kinase [Polyangia bacterium]|nr:protein kinase [Polyangia bacterium]
MDPKAPAKDGPPPLAPTEPEAPPTVTEAPAIGRYVFRRWIGTGGMGVVIAAYDPELDRQVAIKLVLANSDEARARLMREAQAMARLSQPNVVTVYEVIWSGERAGIVMELVDGEDLASWQRTARPGWREVVDAYVQAARGLAAAHRAGLVHRDFKPSNALRDREGVVRVTDFGLVRSGPADANSEAADADAAAEAPASFTSTLTRTGSIVGTPAYMAPEQHMRGTVDARTDQWALACSLYEALYGQRPFVGDNRQALAAAVVRGVPRPEPSDSEVPRRLRAVLRRALAPRPEDRFANMEALIAALSPPRRASRIAAGVAGLLMAAALVTGVVIARHRSTCQGLDGPLTTFWTAARKAAVRARFAAVGAGLPPALADQVIGRIDAYGADWLAARTNACVDGQKGLESRELLDSRMRCLDQRLAELSVVVDGLTEAGPATLRSAGDAVEKLHLVADCQDPRDAVPRPASATARASIVEAENGLARAWALQALEQFERALPLAQKAVAVGERTGFAPLLARALVLRGECEDRKHEYAAAQATYERAASAAADAKDDAGVVEALARGSLVVGNHMGRPAEALASRRFVDLALQRAGQPPRVRAMWHHILAILLYTQEHYDEALASERDAVETWRKIVPPRHVYLVDSLETEGNIEVARGEVAKADALLEEVLAARIASRGPDDPGVSDALTNLGTLEGSRGNLPAALAYLERATASARNAGVPSYLASYNLGLAQLDAGRWQAAVGTLESARATVEREAPGNSVYAGEVEIWLGAAHLALGELDEAHRLIEHGLATARAAASGALVEPLALSARAALARHDLATAKSRLAEIGKRSDGEVSLTLLANAELTRKEHGCREARPRYERALSLVKKDGGPMVKSAATVGLAECLVELGRRADAAALLEPHVAWLNEVGAEPAARAAAKLALARATAR